MYQIFRWLILFDINKIYPNGPYSISINLNNAHIKTPLKGTLEFSFFFWKWTLK